jgi:O-antigen biosynthesis protein WbqP
MRYYIRFGKRSLDIIFAVTAMGLLSWLMLIIAVGVRSSSTGPSIFRQQRVGKNGESFVIYKFRSMSVDTGNVASDQVGSLKIGRFGRFIRRTNLDELPQLINILRGDMSLVGPRPPLPQQTELINLREQNGSLTCRPGLTGLAQVNSYDGMPVKQKAEYDGKYANNTSLLLDLSIIVRTFAYIMRPPPTY